MSKSKRSGSKKKEHRKSKAIKKSIKKASRSTASQKERESLKDSKPDEQEDYPIKDESTTDESSCRQSSFLNENPELNVGSI